MKLKSYGTHEEFFGFKCPGCKDTHMLPTKGPRAWQFNGSVARPTFQPSILAREFNGEQVVGICHSYVTDGQIQFLSDCTHSLAGQTVDLPETTET